MQIYAPFTLWLAIIGMGLVTYAIRLSLLGWWEDLTLPTHLHRALKFVPIAVLSAIILPEMIQPGGTLDLSLQNGRFLAGIIAIIVAYFTKNPLWPIAIGMLVVWGMAWLS